MYDNYNYPMGADTPDAPWNQHEPDPIEVSIGVTVTLTHETTVETTNYANGEDGDELFDGYGELNVLYGEQHMTIPQLLDELKKYIKGELAGANVTYQRKQELMDLLLDCEGWTEEETEVDNVY
jgi:asparagine synthetase B (glutamine-hydrolysing)